LHFSNLNHFPASISHHNVFFFFNRYKTNLSNFSFIYHVVFLINLQYVIFILTIISILSLPNFCILKMFGKHLSNLILVFIIEAMKTFCLLILSLLKFYLDRSLLFFVIMFEIQLSQCFFLFKIFKTCLHFLFLLVLYNFSYQRYFFSETSHFLGLIIALCYQ